MRPSSETHMIEALKRPPTSKSVHGLSRLSITAVGYPTILPGQGFTHKGTGNCTRRCAPPGRLLLSARPYCFPCQRVVPFEGEMHLHRSGNGMPLLGPQCQRLEARRRMEIHVRLYPFPRFLGIRSRMLCGSMSVLSSDRLIHKTYLFP